MAEQPSVMERLQQLAKLMADDESHFAISASINGELVYVTWGELWKLTIEANHFRSALIRIESISPKEKPDKNSYSTDELKGALLELHILGEIARRALKGEWDYYRPL